MITIEKTDVFGFEAAVRGMRNPLNSWSKSDSDFSCKECKGCYYEPTRQKDEYEYAVDIWCNHSALRIGENDLALMRKLAKAGDDHAKFLRMIHVQADITAPLYWWKEYDTYKVGTVANSCSTMHKIHEKEFTLGDFSHEYVENFRSDLFLDTLRQIIRSLNIARDEFLRTKDKQYWYTMIQLLPQSYNQKRTVDLNYQVLAHMYFARRNHKLDEWHDFCAWVLTLPYFKEIVVQEEKDGEECLS